MTIYIVIIYLTIVGLLSLKYKLPQRLFYINCGLVFFIITLRGYDIGSVDTINYIDWCLGKGGSCYERDEDIIEPGFVAYIHFLQPIVLSGTMFLIINAALALAPLFYMVRKYSLNFHLSLMFFFMPLTIMHRFYFVCQRQILGVGMALIGIIIYDKIKVTEWKKILVLSIFTFIAYNLQHFSVILPVVYLLMNKISIKKQSYIIIAVGSLVIGLFLGGIKDFSFLMNVFLATDGDFYQLMRYAEAQTHSSSVNYFQSVIATLIGISMALVYNRNKPISLYAKMYLIGIVLLNLLISAVEVYRIAAMFTIFGMIEIPYTFNKKNIKKTNSWFLVLLFFSIVYCYYSYFWSMYSIYIGENPVGTDSLVPYEFFWEDKYNY